FMAGDPNSSVGRNDIPECYDCPVTTPTPPKHVPFVPPNASMKEFTLRAVLGMAVLRIWKGSVLEENLARTAGSIGESVAAGAIFTLPAFVITGAWVSFEPGEAYWKSTSMMIV